MWPTALVATAAHAVPSWVAVRGETASTTHALSGDPPKTRHPKQRLPKSTAGPPIALGSIIGVSALDGSTGGPLDSGWFRLPSRSIGWCRSRIAGTFGHCCRCAVIGMDGTDKRNCGWGATEPSGEAELDSRGRRCTVFSHWRCISGHCNPRGSHRRRRPQCPSATGGLLYGSGLLISTKSLGTHKRWVVVL